MSLAANWGLQPSLTHFRAGLLVGRRGEEGKNEVSSVKNEVLRSTAASVLSSRGASVLYSHPEQWEREMGNHWKSLAEGLR